jgi:hypothetical protein
MSFISDKLSGASQIAAVMAERSGPGFSKEPADYLPMRVKFIGPEFNEPDPKYRPDLEPLGLLIGDKAIGAEGISVIVLGSLSGCEEKDRVSVDGHEEKRRFALWKRQPEVTPIKGRGGGLKTDRGGWITNKFDEVFVLVNRELGVISLFDQHHVVAELNRQASTLGVNSMYEIAWRLTKAAVTDGDYTKYEPHFEPLGVVGEPNGPSEVEIVQAKKLTALIGRLCYASPDIPLRLVVGGQIGEPPTPPAPPVTSERDYGAERDDDLPDYLRR